MTKRSLFISISTRRQALLLLTMRKLSEHDRLVEGYRGIRMTERNGCRERDKTGIEKGCNECTILLHDVNLSIRTRYVR